MNERKKIISELVAFGLLFIFGIVTLVMFFLEQSEWYYIFISLMFLGVSVIGSIIYFKKLKKINDEEKKYQSDDFTPNNTYEQIKYDYKKNRLKEKFYNYIEGYEIDVEENREFNLLQLKFIGEFHTIYINISQNENECDFVLELDSNLEEKIYDYIKNNKSKYTEEEMDELLYADNLFTLDFHKEDMYYTYEKIWEIIKKQSELFTVIKEFADTI